MPRPLLVLGVGGPADYAEFTLSQVAQAYPIVLADKDVPLWARPYLAHHLPVDLADPPTVLDAVRRHAAEHELGGVLAMDRSAIATVAYVTSARTPHAHDSHGLAACSSPAAVRRLLKRDVFQPRWTMAHGAQSLADHADSIGYPVTLRWPDEPAGPIGPAHTRRELLALYARGRQAVFDATSPLDTVIVEAHLSGPRICAEVVVFNDGGCQLIAVTRTTDGPAPARQALRHSVYAHDELLHNRQIRQTVERTVHALSVTSCVLHIEMTLTSRGPCVTDVSANPANDLIPLLVKRATGISLPQVAAALANSEPPTLAPSRQKAAAVHFAYASTAGGISELALTTPAYRPPVERAVLTQHVGSRVNSVEWASGRDRLAHWVALGDNASACDTTLDEAAKALVVSFAPATSTVDSDAVPHDSRSVNDRACPDLSIPPLGRTATCPNATHTDPAVEETTYVQFRTGASKQRLLPPDSPGTAGDDRVVVQPATLGLSTDDVKAVGGLMAELVSTCAAIGARYDTNDIWQPLAPGPDGQFSEASEVLAHLARTLNRTRAGIRKIHAQAHRRALSRAARIAPGQRGVASS
ncbi:hypothetical protein ACIQ6Y_32015 [Streptomyces sp. NPDC096205]|uniref:hypothetical protein n=1 Tax=Streptomyces sp. NPDC096205 TaxID=3366081 RepID=UPI003825FD43